MMADIRVPAGLDIRPDGQRVVFSMGHFTKSETHPQSSIWVVDTSGDTAAQQITSDLVNNSAPAWSPDGSKIAFLADREKRGTQQLWMLSMEDGGEALQMTDRLGGVQHFAWLPGDSNQIACVIPDARDPEEQKQREKTGDDANVYGEFWPFGRLAILDIASKELRDIELGNRHISIIAPSPSGDRLALVSSELPTLESMVTTVELVLVDLDSLEVATIAHLDRRCHNLVWDRAGTSITYLASAGPVPAVSSQQIWTIEATPGAEPRLLTADLPACVMALGRGKDAEHFHAVVHRGVESDIYRLDLESGAFEPVTHIVGDAVGISISDDGSTGVLSVATPSCPNEVYATNLGDGLTRLSSFQAAFEELDLGPTEVVTWERAGFTLDGILLFPHGKSREDGPLPTAVSLHGGPYGRWPNAFFFPRPFAHWLAAQGYLVFMPNPRGGLGHGEAFASAVAGSVGDQDWEDIVAGIDMLVDEGVIDPSKMGVGGWSQGGFMTAWAIGHDDPDEGPRFKCAIMGAGVSDWGMMVATSDMETFEQALGGGNPYTGIGPHEFDKWSPISYVHRARTPTLILHGEQDARVPLNQAIFMHRGLKKYGVEVEMVTYPREPHGLQEHQHVVDLHRRVAEWYQRWIPLD